MKRLLTSLLAISFSGLAMDIQKNCPSEIGYQLLRILHEEQFEKMESLIDAGLTSKDVDALSNYAKIISLDSLERYTKALGGLLEDARAKDNVRVCDFLKNTNLKSESRQFTLIWAAEKGDLASLIKLVEKEADIHTYDELALQRAAENGHLKVVQFLVEQGADIHIDNEAALKQAAENGHLKVVQFLLEQGAMISIDWFSPLTVAAKKGHLDIVRLLLEQSPERYLTNSYVTISIMSKALIAAAGAGQLETVKFFLEAATNMGADKRLDETIYRAFLRAAEHGHLGMVQYLMALGTNVHFNLDFGDNPALVEALDASNTEVAIFLIQQWANVNERGRKGYPLECATKLNCFELVQLLIEHNADISANHKAAERHACNKNYIEIIELLVNAGAKSGIVLKWAAENNRIDLVEKILANGAKVESSSALRALKVAVKKEYNAVAELLFKAKADPLSCGFNDPHALALAAAGNNLSLVTLFVESGTDPYFRKHSYANPILEVAVENNCYDVAQWLIEREKDLFTVRKGKTLRALKLAAAAGNIEIIKLFIAQGLFEHPELAGQTLTEAGRSGSIALVELLLSGPIDINFKANTCTSSTILYQAASHEQPQLVTFLINAGADVRELDWALIWLAGRGEIEMVKFLIENGADFHIHDCMALKEALMKDRREVVEYLLTRKSYTPDDLPALIKDKGNGYYAKSALALAIKARNDKAIELIVLQVERIYRENQIKNASFSAIGTEILVKAQEILKESTSQIVQQLKLYQGESCTICVDGYTNLTTKCGHKFHANCLMGWLATKNVCPNCREEIVRPNNG